MSLFRKPKRNFRQRAARNDSDDENDPEKSSNEKKEEVVIPFLEEHCASKQLEKNAARNPIVSFDNEEDDGEVFKVKKSSYSRRLAKMLEKERKQKKKGGNKEAGSSSPNIDSHFDSPSPDIEEVNKTDTGQYNRVLNGDDADEMDLDSDAEQGHQFDPVKKVLESGAIPDAAMIHEARKRRQMAREMGDFVPVDDTVRYDKGASRLVRDDDNDRSDEEDEDERISFTVTTAQAEREKVRQAIMDSHRAGSESGSEEHDEEFKRWEDEQIRKGVSIPQIQPPTHTVPQTDPNLYQQYMYTGPTPTMFPTKDMMSSMAAVVMPVPIVDLTSGVEESGGHVGALADSAGPIYKKTVVPRFTANENSPESIRKKLTDRLKSLREVQRAHEREKDSLRCDLTNSELSVRLLEAELPNLTRSFNFYQEMRGWGR